MITNEIQYRSTKAHLATFEEAAANLQAQLDEGHGSKLIRLELDAVNAQADELRAEVAEYEHLRSGEVSSFDAGSLPELATCWSRPASPGAGPSASWLTCWASPSSRSSATRPPVTARRALPASAMLPVPSK